MANLFEQFGHWIHIRYCSADSKWAMKHLDKVTAYWQAVQTPEKFCIGLYNIILFTIHMWWGSDILKKTLFLSGKFLYKEKIPLVCVKHLINLHFSDWNL